MQRWETNNEKEKREEKSSEIIKKKIIIMKRKERGTDVDEEGRFGKGVEKKKKKEAVNTIALQSNRKLQVEVQ